MKNFNKILSIAKQIANSVLKGKTETEGDEFFSETDRNEIFSRLTDQNEKGKRVSLFEKIEASKKKDWNKIYSVIDTKSNYFKMQVIKRIAAVFIGVLGLSYFLMQGGYFSQNDDKLIINDDAVIIELNDGKVEVITANGAKKIVNEKGEVVGVQQGSAINYSNASVLQQKGSENSTDAAFSTQDLAYNLITVPYGKSFQLVLSDGTKVHLNAGTSLKYPVTFLEGLNREVYLEGEAYFDVTENEEHPFIVNANDVNIRVLGTSFNVSSYPEDAQINTVLVSGSVSLYGASELYNDDLKKLVPGNLGAWDKENKTIEYSEVDTDIYTGWVDGKMIFKRTPFKIIRKKLERHYNVTIKNNNVLLDSNIYNAVFETESIEEVLTSFQKNFNIDYQIKDNQVIIN